jgi:hypothetical protein
MYPVSGHDPGQDGATRGLILIKAFGGKRHAMGMRAPILVEAKLNARWSLDLFTIRWLMANASASSTSSMM